jgi:uncharacterized protein
MLFNINRIPEGHSVLSQNVSLGGEQSEGLLLAGDISCYAEIDRFQAQIYVRLTYNCKVQTQCSRCLTPVKQPVSGEFRIVLQERTQNGESHELSEEDVDLFFNDSTESIDIAPLIFDEIMTSLPMKPLCSEQCEGISLNGNPSLSVEYGPNKITIDPRWEALKKLKTL